MLATMAEPPLVWVWPPHPLGASRPYAATQNYKNAGRHTPTPHKHVRQPKVPTDSTCPGSTPPPFPLCPWSMAPAASPLP